MTVARSAALKLGAASAAGVAFVLMAAQAAAAPQTNGQRITALESAVAQLQGRVTALEQRSSPTPTAAPTAPPTPAPTPAACSATLPNGSGDQTSALQSLVNAAPNGATICFTNEAHVINGRVSISGRSGLTFTGPATLVSVTSRGNFALFAMFGSTGITFRNLTLDGGKGDCRYSPSHEYEHAVDFRDSSGTVDHVTARNFGGDFVYIGANGSGASNFSHDVVVRDSSIDCNGRQGIAITSGRDILVERTTFSRVGLFAFDLEPNYAVHGGQRITIRDNVVNAFGFDNVSPSCGSVPCTPYFFSFATIGTASDLVITNNRVTSGHLRTQIVSSGASNRIARVTFTGNTAPDATKTLTFGHIDGLTISGNSGVYAISDCSGVVGP